MDNANVKLTVLPGSANPVFTQRENLIAHTSYREETAFFSYLKHGMTDKVKESLAGFTSAGLVVGRLSDDPLTQCKYWSVCCITLGTRYAIEGGLNEMTAFNLSDKHIRAVDALNSTQEITAYLANAVVELSELVRLNARSSFPTQIKKCLEYIDVHLHENIKIENIAKEVGFNADYLSKYFRKHVGKSLTDYVTDKKLEEARALMINGAELSSVAYALGFCSQSYFTARFKRKYGITPLRFLRETHGLGENAI